jgi:hypothetical protein
MSTNPAGKEFKDRFVVDDANARAPVWIRLPDALERSSLVQASKHIFSFEKIRRDESAAHAILDLKKYPELGALLGEVAALFHEQYTQALANGEPNRKQRVPVTIDSLWRVARYLQHDQAPTPARNTVDLIATLKGAIYCHYIQLLASKPSVVGSIGQPVAAPSPITPPPPPSPTPSALPPGPTPPTSVRPQSKTLGESLLDKLSQTLTNSTTHPVQFRGTKTTYEEAITVLTEEAWNQELALEKSSSQKSAAEVARAQQEVARLHAQLSQNRSLLAPDEFHAFLIALKETADTEALAALEAWEEAQQP